MQIGFIGDVHLNAGRKHSQYNGINVYNTLLGALDQAKELIPSDEIFFLGDIFDKYSHYDQEVIDFIDWVKKYPESNFYTITGNHDTSKKKFWNVGYNPYNVLYIVEKACPNFHIIDINKDKLSEFGIYTDHKVRVFGLPYFEYESEFLSALKYVATESQDLRNNGWKTVLLMHQNLEKFIRLSTIQHTDPLFSKFDLTINGHIHSPQWVIKNKFLLQGSLITSTKSDESKEKKNVSVLNCDTFKVTRKVLKGLPEFKYYKEGTEIKEEDKNNFIIWERDVKDNEKVSKTKEKFKTLPYKDIIHKYCSQNNVDKKLLNNLNLSILDSDVDNAHINLFFKEIEIEGFGSYVNPVKYDLSTEGITWIRGLPGSGKSTIFKAFNWVLEGRYYNKENPFADPTSKEAWSNLSSTGYRGCRVQLLFLRNGEEHLLVRHKNFKGESLGKKGKNYVHLYKLKKDKWVYINLDKMYEGEFDDTHAALSRNNLKLMKYLGINPSMLKYTMIVSPEYFDLISMKQSDVRDVFYSLIDLSWIDDLDKQLYTKFKDAETELHLLTHNKELTQTELTGIFNRISDQEENYKSEMKRYEGHKASLESEKIALEEKRLLYKLTIKEQSKCLKQYDISRMGWYEQKYPKEKDDYMREKEKLSDLEVEYKEYKDELLCLNAIEVDSILSNVVSKLEDKLRNATKIYKDKKHKLNLVEIEISKLETKWSSARNRIDIVNDKIKEIDIKLSSDHSICPTCGQTISSDSDYYDHIQSYKSSLYKEKERYELEREALLESVTEDMINDEKYKKHLLTEEIVLLQQELKAIEDKHRESVLKIKLAEQSYNDTLNKKQLLESKIAKTSSKIEQTKKLISNFEKNFVDVDRLAEDFSEYKSCHLKLVKAEKSLKDSDSVLNVLNDQISIIEAGKPTKKNLAELKKTKSKLAKDLNDIDKSLVKTEKLVTELQLLKKSTFHARGIKPFAISFYLDYLNSACSSFAEIAGIKLTTSLNDSGNFEFTVVIDETELDGRELSKGWTTFSNLVLLGGLTQMREINVMSNVLAVDEPFSTVPEESTPTIMNLIRDMSYNKGLHVIAHSSMLEASNARFIDVVGGISKLKRTLQDGTTKLVNVPTVSSFS